MSEQVWPALTGLDVLSLNAGPQLDALVEGYVFGRTVEVAVTQGTDYWLIGSDNEPVWEQARIAIQHYSTDWAMLPTLLAKMRERWPLSAVEPNSDMCYVSNANSLSVTAIQNERIETHLPAWACRAALWLAQQEVRRWPLTDAT